MKKFNPENKEQLTYREALEPAMEITSQEDADQYKKAYIAYTEKFLIDGVSESGLTAEQIVNTNLGYYAGYYSPETSSRVNRLFNCSHPIFGKRDQPMNQQELTPEYLNPTQVNLVLDVKPGTWFIASVIGKGIYEMVQHGINHTGSKYAIVRCKKLFGKGWESKDHETTCHPVEPYTWNNLKRIKVPNNG